MAERYRAVAERAARACVRSGRSAGDVAVVVAAKMFSPEAVEVVVEAGAADVGENYVQEAVRKRKAISRPSLRWHLLGRLQRNKAKQAIEIFDLIQSLDTIELGRALDRAASCARRMVRCLVEVNLGGESSKAGVSPSGLADFLVSLSDLETLQIDGLMTIPPPGESAEANRPHFSRLRQLRDDCAGLRLPNVRLKELSMGMSADFEVAIEEGATMVRVGRAIFGRRPRGGRE